MKYKVGETVLVPSEDDVDMGRLRKDWEWEEGIITKIITQKSGDITYEIKTNFCDRFLIWNDSEIMRKGDKNGIKED